MTRLTKQNTRRLMDVARYRRHGHGVPAVRISVSLYSGWPHVGGYEPLKESAELIFEQGEGYAAIKRAAGKLANELIYEVMEEMYNARCTFSVGGRTCILYNVGGDEHAVRHMDEGGFLS